MSWDDGPCELRLWAAKLDDRLFRFVEWIQRKARG